MEGLPEAEGLLVAEVIVAAADFAADRLAAADLPEEAGFAAGVTVAAAGIAAAPEAAGIEDAVDLIPAVS